MPRPAQFFRAVLPDPVPVQPGPTPEELCADGTLGVRGLARFTGLSVTTCRELVRVGELPSLTVGTRRLVPRRAAVRWLAGKLREATG